MLAVAVTHSSGSWGFKVELSGSGGAHAPIIGRYEREEVKPSVEIASKIAEALEVSLDYLTGLSDIELDKGIVDTITGLQKLNQEDQQHILTTLMHLYVMQKHVIPMHKKTNHITVTGL